ATSSASRGGQRPATTATGRAPTTAATVATAATRRTAGSRQPRSSATVSTASRRAPAHPAGHDTTAPGTPAPTLATRTSQWAGQLPSQARNPAASGHTGDAAAASTPASVAGTTAGAAARLAATETRLMVPDSP